MRRLLLSAFAALVAALVFGGPLLSASLAQSDKADAAAKQEPPEKLRTGVISSQGRFARKADVNTRSTEEAAGGEPSPVSGSISKGDRGRCLIRLSNESDYSYRVRYVAVGERDGRQAFRKSFTSTIPAKGALEKQFNGCDDKSINLMLELSSGTRLKK